MEAMKNDSEKECRPELITPQFIEGIGKVLAFGAKKYESWNWIKSVGTEDHNTFRDRCYGALQRHLLAIERGEYLDSETGLPHHYHAGCCLMFIEEYDRYRHEV